MTINVTFGSMDEMKDFARAFLSDGAATAAQQAASAPAATPTRQAPTEQAPAQQANQAAVQAPTQQPMPTQTSAQVPVQSPAQPAPTQQAVPTSQPTYAMDDLSRAAMTLMDTGRQDELRKLLAQFGVQSLPDLPQEQYGAFATALRGMGAKI